MLTTRTRRARPTRAQTQSSNIQTPCAGCGRPVGVRRIVHTLIVRRLADGTPAAITRDLCLTDARAASRALRLLFPATRYALEIVAELEWGG
jgi:ribosomal protein S14